MPLKVFWALKTPLVVLRLSKTPILSIVQNMQPTVPCNTGKGKVVNGTCSSLAIKAWHTQATFVLQTHRAFVCEKMLPVCAIQRLLAGSILLNLGHFLKQNLPICVTFGHYPMFYVFSSDTHQSINSRIVI